MPLRRLAGQCGAITRSAICGHTELRRAVACGIDTPSAGLASMRSQKLPGPSSGAAPGFTCGSAATAIVMSAMKPTVAPTKPRGLTPTTVTGTPLTSTVWPTRAGAARDGALPVAVADHGHQWRTGLIVFACEQTSDHGVQAECLVVAAGDDCAGNSADGPGSADVITEAAEASHVPEDLALFGHRTDDCVGEAPPTGAVSRRGRSVNSTSSCGFPPAAISASTRRSS